MANSNTALATFRSFAQLSGPQQYAVNLKARGVMHKEIASRLGVEYGIACSHNTVNQWFAAGGNLEQALNEYLERIADESLKEAKTLVKLATKPAIETIVYIMRHSPSDLARLRAAQIILNKYIPDGQRAGVGAHDDELPEELAEAMDRELHVQN